MTNWKKYINDAKYLIALLPGLEIARDAMNEEIASIREAIGRGTMTDALADAAPSPEATAQPAHGRTKARRKAKAKGVKVKALPAAVAVPEQMETLADYLGALALRQGQISNAQFREAAQQKDNPFPNMTDPKHLSVAVAAAIHKHRTLRRVAVGTYEATEQFKKRMHVV